MPQLHLPMFPHGVTSITPELAVEKREGQVTYFNGHMPIFLHAAHDVRTFRMITAQFCVNGSVTQMEIVRAFGVSVISVKRAVQRYRTHGPSGFYATPRRRGAAVLTPSILVEAQRLLDAGRTVSDVAMELGIKANTLAKAVHAGRVHRPEKKSVHPS